MTHYIIKKTTDLTNKEIEIILENWQIEDWLKMNKAEFVNHFQQSEFHLLTDVTSNLLCIARINFDFNFIVAAQQYNFPELVGLVAVEKNNGYGKALLTYIIENLHSRNVEAIGFCQKPLRPFYEKCSIIVLYNQAKWFREKSGDEWISSDDDDVLDLTLSKESRRIFENLNADQLALLL